MMTGWYIQMFLPNWILCGVHIQWTDFRMAIIDVSRFNSRFYEPNTEAVDTFTCDRQEEVN